MQKIVDIMTSKVFSLKQSDNLYQARMLLKEHNIRHMPITDENGRFTGLLTRRDLLNYAFTIVENYGFSKLEEHEKRTPIKEVMNVECRTVAPDTSLYVAGRFFIDDGLSCLPVVDNGELAGIVTSVDFVKLALYLLDK